MRVHHTIAIALASCAFAIPALADKPGSKGGSEQIRVAPGVAIVIQPRDRSAIQDYYRRNGPPGCPPGLAKKNNGCMPPGQAKKHYRNETLGPGIVIQGLPSRLLELLTPPPPGYGWGYVDGDVMLYALATRLIVDLVSSR